MVDEKLAPDEEGFEEQSIRWTRNRGGFWACPRCWGEAHWCVTRDVQILSPYCPQCGAKMARGE